jgi:predicted membrane protein
MLNRREFWGALILIIGLIFLFGNLDFIDFSARRFIRNLWPVILIIVGIAFILRHSGRKGKNNWIKDSFSYRSGEHIHGSTSHVFGDSNIEAKNIEIDGLDNSSVFGDISINLAGAKLKAGVNKVFVSATFGDITVIVPSNMEAKAYGATTFGDLYVLGRSASGISNRLTMQSDGYDNAADKVYISATTTFGDIKVYKS